MLLVVALSLFAGMVPNLIQLASAESEAPVGEDESPEDEAVRSEAGNDIRRISSCEASRLPTFCDGRFPKTIDMITASPSGHRFSNGLSAPLRC